MTIFTQYQPGQNASGNEELLAHQNGKDVTITDSELLSPILNQFVNAINFGAKGDGVTNDTIALQAALNAAAGGTLYLPGGFTFIASGLTGPANTQIVALGRCTIQRPANDTGNSPILAFTNVSRFSIGGPLVLDGNEANDTQETAQNCLLISGCWDFNLLPGLHCVNATGCGVVIQNGQDGAKSTTSIVDGISCRGNQQYGFYLLGSDYTKVVNGDYSHNVLDGMILDGSVDVNSFIISNNTANYNGQSGFYVVGHKNNDPTQTSIKTLVCDGNIATYNQQWGFILQGEVVTATGNEARFNGYNNNHAGIVINGYDVTANANDVTNNFYFGFDIGGAFRVKLNGNIVEYNGNPAGGGLGINVEGSQDVAVIGNTLADNGAVGQAGAQIYVRGIGGAGGGSGGTPFQLQTKNVHLDGNTIFLTQPYAAIVIDKDCDQVVYGTNAIFGATDPKSAVLIDAKTVTTGKSLGDATMRNPVLASATELVIPDVGDFFFVSGSSAIEYIYSAGESRHLNRTWRFDVSNGGTGYTASFGFTLTTGETGYANVYGGKVVTLFMISDAPSTATFSFNVPGGTGTGATGIATMGLENNDGREITLMFQAALTVQMGGNLNLTANHTVGTASVLKLRGAYGNWYEESFKQ